MALHLDLDVTKPTGQAITSRLELGLGVREGHCHDTAMGVHGNATGFDWNAMSFRGAAMVPPKPRKKKLKVHPKDCYL